MKILLGSQSYQARSKAANGQRLVNLYAEPNPEGSKYPFSIYNTPGLVEWCDLGTSKAVQGMQVMGSLLYAFSGNEVFKITDEAAKTSLGSITGTEERVDLSNNGTQMTAVTSDGDGFVITSSAVAAISDGDFPSASSTSFIDGFTVVTVKDSGQFNLSTIYDSTVWDASYFSTAEETPDNLVRCFSFNSALWLFGKKSYEVYGNTGNSDFPFEQIGGAANTTRGLGAKFSVSAEDNGLFWLGEDRIVYRADGFMPQRISTFAIEKLIEEVEIISDAFGLIYNQSGHKFYVLSFPSGNLTVVFDLASGLWHERTTLTEGLPYTWRANCHAAFAEKQLIGDVSNGKIYYLDQDIYKDDGNMVERIAQGPTAWRDDKRVSHDAVFLDIEPGVGLTAGQGSDPQVLMRYSDDGAKTWSNYRSTSMGKIGEYQNRCVWRRNGRARGRIYQFRVTDPVKVSINGAYIESREGK